MNSAQILFVIDAGSPIGNIAITVLGPPAYEPQFFTSVASFLSDAYFHKKKIGVEYFEVPLECDQLNAVYTVTP